MIRKKSSLFLGKYILRTVLAVLIGLSGLMTVTACFGNKAPERSYFSVDYALGTQPKYPAPKYNATVVVQNMTSVLAYDRQEIVYRTNPYEFQYYWYRLWASKPRKMLRELVTGHLRYTQMFSRVTSTIEDKLPDYTLDVEIMAIEEMDVSDREWYAHLSLQFTMQRVRDNVNVWSYSFDSKRAVADNQPVYVIKAMSELLDEELVKAFQDLDAKMGSSIHSESSVSAEESAEISPPSERVLHLDVQDAVPTGDDSPSAVLKNRK